MLRIRDVYPMFIPDPTFSIPDPGSRTRIRFFSNPEPGSRIHIKEFKFFNPKNCFLSSRKYDPGFSSWIRILIFHPSQIPDPEVKKAPDPDPHHCSSNGDIKFPGIHLSEEAREGGREHGPLHGRLHQPHHQQVVYVAYPEHNCGNQFI